MAQAFRDDGDGDGDGDGRIPDLSRLTWDGWLDALRPLNPQQRIAACNFVTTQAEVSRVLALIGQLKLEEGAAQVRAIVATPPRMPVGDPPPPMELARRQVNFRLSTGEHVRLLEAARLFGMRPNALARLLTMRGADRALAEARSDR